MTSYLPLLQKCKLFSVLSPSVIENELLPHAQLREFVKGSYILFPQQRLDHFSVLLKGSLRTEHIFSDGSYSVMDRLRPPEVFGADLICTRSRISPYHAVATETCLLMSFPCELLQAGTFPEDTRQKIMAPLLTLIANLNMQKEYRLAILSQKGLRERILTYLTMQADKRRTESFTVPFSREEMASFLCVNRSALSHELSLMKQEGLIDFRKNHFTVLHRRTEKPTL